MTQETKYKLKSGQEVTLPLHYKNWKWMMATFTVPAKQVQKLLPPKLKPILALPVKTEEAYNAGCEIWGFPKVVREMKFEENEKAKSCRLIDGGKEVLILDIEKIPLSKNKKDFVYCSYTEKDGQLLRTCIHANGNYGIKKITGKASVKFGTGTIAKEMKKLHISKRPIHIFFAANIESALPLAAESLPS